MKATELTPPAWASIRNWPLSREAVQVIPFEPAQVRLARPGPVFLEQLAGAAHIVLVPGDAGEVHIFV